MKTRRPLSNAEEEPHFLAADEGRENFRDRMKSHVQSGFAWHGKAMNQTVLALALMGGGSLPWKPNRTWRELEREVSIARILVNAYGGAKNWTDNLYPEELPVQKARKSPVGVSESELIEAALDAGIELGLQTLPAKARKAVDVAAARKVARRRLMAGAFRKNLAALEESQRGLAVLLNASRDPALTILKDAGRLADAFGLNSRQATTLVRETRALVEAGKETAAIKRAMARRVQQAIEARAELLADELGREAIGVTQSALFEQAKKQGLLEEERHLQEWVTRHDDAVCEICDELDGQRVEIGEPFESGITGEQYDDAHAHPRCRCKKRIVTVRTPDRQTRRRAA